MHLSEHFTLAELCKSQIALRQNITNQPNDAQTMALRQVAGHILEPVREAFEIPFAPNSGFRSPLLNSTLGGSFKSQHMSGEAVDIEIPGISNRALAHWIDDYLKYDQLILECFTPGEPSSGWVHVSYGSNMRQEALTFVPGSGYKKGLIVDG